MTKTLRVLHVEDSEQDVALLARYLKRAGYELISDRVDTADAMKAALETREWDLILCDYSMPRLNALKALALTKEMDLDIPFIIISGTVGEAMAVEAMRAGAHDYLMKDNLVRLAATIERELHEVENRRARRRAEAALYDTNWKLQTFIQASPLAIVALDLERRVTLWNPAAERYFGWTESEVIGQVLPTIPPEDLQEQLALRDQFLSEGTIIANQETRRLRKDGSIIQVSASFAPLRSEQGAITGTIGIIADITERKRAERALRESEERLQTVVENLAEGLVISDLDGQVIHWNRAALDMCGFRSMDECLLRLPEFEQIFELSTPDGSVLDMEQLPLWRIIRGEHLRNLELCIRRIDSDWKRIFSYGGALVREPSGKQLAFVTITDITDRMRAQEALRRKNEEIATMTQQLWQSSKLATMGELAASVAHELNNPLATIALRTELLADQLAGDEAKQASAEVVLTEVERMAKLVENLLQFSRRSHRQISTVDVAEEISNSVRFISYYLRNRNINVAPEFSGDVSSVQADRQQLRQLFLNLLTNAADAMPGGGTLITRVTPAEIGEANGVMIEFIDSGIGIPPEHLDRIWDSFFTTKPEGKGTGLGLAICRRIVEEHRGEISIASRLGEGTTVSVFLPATKGLNRNKKDQLSISELTERLAGEQMVSQPAAERSLRC